MFGKLLKIIKRYVKSGGFRAGAGDRSMTFQHKAIIALTFCNVTIFVIYAPVL